MATVEGRVLGLDAYSKDVLIAAVAEQGVMAVNTRTGRTWVLADRLDGNLIFFPDAVSVAADGTIYFTEASTVYLPGFPNDFLDGRPHGRLLRYEPATGATSVVADGLYFANGVQVAPDETLRARRRVVPLPAHARLARTAPAPERPSSSARR